MEIIVVLGTALIKGKLSTEGIGRLKTALEVFNYQVEDRSKTIFIVSGNGAKENITEAEAMRDYLISKGVKPDIIITDRLSNNTIENIINTNQIIKQVLSKGVKVKSITYVSSEYHLPRIVKILEYFSVKDIELFASGSKVYPKSREIKEKEIMKHFDQSLSKYIQN